ncbi:hypothetical protein JGU66_10235 [Myxococcaceae bacterium JPH2]|nr:hypothetical protein [Myxococcaceae bacterium JPH2]
MRTALLLSLLLAPASFAAPRKVAVLPIQALSGDVPTRAGPRVTARLASEVRAVEGLSLSEPPATPAPSDALTRARAAMRQATEAREAHDFPRAEAALTEARDAYAAGASGLTDPGEVADAYALSAAVRYATGQDDEAERLLTHALTLAPGRTPPLAATSPLFARTVERTRAALQARPPGVVSAASIPPGVPLSLDGRPVGVTPLRITEVPPGAHLWQARLPSGEVAGGVVVVAPGSETRVDIAPTASTGPDSVLARALAGNTLDAASLEAATTLGRAAGADLIVLGAVSRAGGGLALDAFVFAPGDAAPRRLPRLALDNELLDSGEPLRQLVATLVSRELAEATPVTLPALASREPLPTPRATLAPYPTGEAPARPVDRSQTAPIRRPLVKP